MVSHKIREVMCLLYAVFYFVSGWFFIALSIYFLFKLFYYFELIPSSSVAPFFVLSILGVIHIFATWIAIKGPTREHNFHIVMFLVLTMVLLITEFFIGVWVMFLWDEVEISIIQAMTESFHEFKAQKANSKVWDKMQINLNCCGLNENKDFSNTVIPQSCFINNDLNNTTYSRGCKVPLIRYTKHVLLGGAGCGFGWAAFEALGFYLYYSFFTSLKLIRNERINRRTELQRELASLQSELQPPLQRQSYSPVATEQVNVSNTSGGGVALNATNGGGGNRATLISSNANNAVTPPVSTTA